MDAEQLEAERARLAARHGEWTAHNIHLGGRAYTFAASDPRFEAQLVGHGQHLRRVMQIAADVTGRPLAQLRVLDLACLEGLYGVEFARHGAEVVGIEGREANLEKARFAKDALGLDRFTLELNDVRNLAAAKHGRFDVVLCLGILYHLDAPDVFSFIERMAEVCTCVTIIDTQVAVKLNRTVTHGGAQYRGYSYVEPGADEAERVSLKWAAMGNPRSFWFSRPSLFNALTRAGFSSVYTCQSPAVPAQQLDRDTIVAIKGEPVTLASTPAVNAIGVEMWPETSAVGLHPTQQGFFERGNLLRRAARAGRDTLRRVLG